MKTKLKTKTIKLEINDLFCELREENERLFCELQFADKKIKRLEEVLNSCENCRQNQQIVNQFIECEKDLTFERRVKSKTKTIAKNKRKTNETNVVFIENIDNSFDDNNSKRDAKTTEDETNRYVVATNDRRKKSIDVNQPLKRCRFCDYSNSSQSLLKAHMNRLHLNVRPHECHVCGKRFFSKTVLTQHMKCTHTTADDPSKVWYVCPVLSCGKRYHRQKSLGDHMKTCHLSAENDNNYSESALITAEDETIEEVMATNERPKKCRESIEKNQSIKSCNFCDYINSSHSLVKAHMNRHHLNVRPHECHVCGKRFFSKTVLTQHMKCSHTTAEDPSKFWFVCPEPSCGKRYHREKSLDHHIQTIHSTPGKEYVCDREDCTFKTTNLPNFRTHRRRHGLTKQFRCLYPGCDSSFRYKWSLDQHMASHSDERNYPCEWPGCDMKSKTLHHLRRHQQRHMSGPEPAFGCLWPGCESRFKTKVNLLQHIRNVHKNVRNFVCDWPECGKRFPGADILSQHMNTHKGIKPYLCPIYGCGHRYAAKTNLTKHIQTAHKN